MKIWQTPDGGRLTSIAADSPDFITVGSAKVIYFNNTDSEDVHRTVVYSVRQAVSGFLMPRKIVSEQVSVEDTTSFDWYDGPRQEPPPDIGLYFWDPVSDEILVKSVSSSPGTYLWHELFAKELIANGRFPSDWNYKLTPRGATNYYENSANFCVMGGQPWLTVSLAQRVCSAFGYNYIPYKWCLLPLDIYALGV